MISFLRDLILRNRWLKLFSLILAALIYFTVSFVAINHPNESVRFTPGNIASSIRVFDHLPVLIMCSAAEARRFRVEPEQVAVTVQGDPQALTRLRPEDVRAWVDLSGLETNTDLSKHIEVSAPMGVTHTYAAPSDVHVLFLPRR